MQLPMFALVSFGLYSIMVIGWSLATFPSCPEAATSLQLVRTTLGHPLSVDPACPTQAGCLDASWGAERLGGCVRRRCKT